MASRPETLSHNEKDLLRSLPLFLRADVAGEYVQLDGRGPYISLRLDQGCTDKRVLMRLIQLRLSISDHLIFVSLEELPRPVQHLHSELGVEPMLASAFVARYVCQALPKMAADPEQLEPILNELRWWMETKAVAPWRPAILEAAKNQPFVAMAAGGGYRKPSELLDPENSLVSAFAAHLQQRLPAEQYKAHLKLLRTLGLKSSPPAECVLDCATALGEEAGRVQPPSQEMLRKSCLLVHEVCTRLAKVWADEVGAGAARGRTSQTLLGTHEEREREKRVMLEAAGKRIAPVRSAEEPAQRVERTAVEHQLRRAAQQLCLQPFRGLLLTSEGERLAWTQMPSLATEELTREITRSYPWDCMLSYEFNFFKHLGRGLGLRFHKILNFGLLLLARWLIDSPRRGH